eukprot:scaffold105870_cov33-Tisochrysis_lutea.AAC.2
MKIDLMPSCERLLCHVDALIPCLPCGLGVLNGYGWPCSRFRTLLVRKLHRLSIVLRSPCAGVESVKEKRSGVSK